MQGKCVKCKTRWTWDREIPLHLTFCWRCGGRDPLQATSCESKLPAEKHPSLCRGGSAWLDLRTLKTKPCSPEEVHRSHIKAVDRQEQKQIEFEIKADRSRPGSWTK
jgi:hypothetical protein